MDWSFWPNTRHPQWDAIGIAPDNSLVLVEAKANIEEVKSKIRATDSSSKEIIKSTIFNELDNNDKWLTMYYQIANRLVFLKKIKEHYGSTRNVYCVFLYFADDFTLDGTSRKKASKVEWEEKISSIHKEVSIPDSIRNNIKEIIVDIWKESGVE